jgi:hypothetical protein
MIEDVKVKAEKLAKELSNPLTRGKERGRKHAID